MKKVHPLLLFIASFIVVDIANFILLRELNSFGLVPRSLHSLTGVFTAPWLHGNLSHMFTNVTALAVFALILWQWGQARFWKITFFIIITSGLLVWIFGRSAYHIGASGLVYGYFAFCLIGGWLSGRPLLILLSVIVAVVYGSLIWGVLPIQAGVSFEYHLSGFIMGLIAAKIWAKGH